MKIVVIGGTGLVGRGVVQRLRDDGHEVIVAARSTSVDIVTGAGLAGALAGADVVVDASNSEAPYGESSYEFFTQGIHHLLAAEADAGIKHHIAISVVGTGRLAESPYFRGKADQEAALRASGIPFSILHATQFFEFLLAIVESAMAQDEQVIRLSPAYIQPVGASDVAAAVARLAVSPPVNGVIEMAGPERERMTAIVTRFLAEVESPFEVIEDKQASYFGATLADESLVPGDGAQICGQSYLAWYRRSPYAQASW